MRDQTVPCMLEGLQQQRRQPAERDRVGAQLGALGGLQKAIWVTLMCFFCAFVIWWFTLALGGCACSVAPHGGLCSGHIPGAVRSLVLCVALVYPCSHSGIGECKAAGLMGLALAWYAGKPLCCAPCTHTHLNGVAQWGSLVAT